MKTNSITLIRFDPTIINFTVLVLHIGQMNAKNFFTVRASTFRSENDYAIKSQNYSKN